MAEKDLIEKHLEEYNDVFADIVNALLFAGEQVVLPGDLQDHEPRSIYKSAGRLREQERDVAKLWTRGGAILSLVGLENQTAIDPDMPLRVAGYDGAAYRAQLSGKGRRKKGEKPDKTATNRYPVITLVLYFGEQRWEKPRTLFDRLTLPDRLRPFVHDFRLNLFEIAWLTDKELARFHSDFRIVADYFVQMRRDGDYQPSRQVIAHVDAILKAMAVLTRDKKFEDTQNSFATATNQEVTMTSILDKYIARGVEKGLKQGMEKGMEKGRAETARQLLQLGLLPPDKIALASGMSLEAVLALMPKKTPEA